MSINQDFQPPRGSSSPRKNKSKIPRMVGIAVLILFVGIGLLLLSGGSSPELEARETPIVVSAPTMPPVPPEPVREEIKNTVPSGSSITALLGDYFTAQEIYNLNLQSHDVFPFTKICAGKDIKVNKITQIRTIALYRYCMLSSSQTLSSSQGRNVSFIYMLRASVKL